MLPILLIAGQQANGPGLSAGAGYVAQLTRRLKADGLAPVVHLFRPLDLSEISPWLDTHSLVGYELVVLQPDFGRLTGRRLRQQLSVILGRLHVVRSRLCLLTPLPQRNASFKRMKHRTVCLDVARSWGVSCLDTTDILGSSDEFFQPDAQENLSAVAHELLGSELYWAYTGLTDPAGPSPALLLPTNMPAWRRYFTPVWL